MANVSASKPKTGGAIHVAPLGSTAPTDATTALDTAYISLGYCSEDGVTNADSKSYDAIKAWGGDTVLTSQTDHSDTFTFKLIETLNENVLKTVYGASNVTGTLSAGLTVKSNATETPAMMWAIDMVLKGGTVRRISIPNGMITEIGEIAYNDSDAIGYEITVTAMPDITGNTHYEYTKNA